MRIALVYDRVYPQNIGGLERYYDALARGLAPSHSVTYVTQEPEDRASLAATPRPYRVVTVAPASAYYSGKGNRRIWPALRFGIGVFGHLLRRGGSYDVIHCASFPFFSVFAARLAFLFRRRRPKLVVDWLEVWDRDYWIEYAGGGAGRVGYGVQQLCMKAPDHGLTYSRLHEARLGAHRQPVLRLTGLAADAPEPASASDPLANERSEAPTVVYAGRHIAEKQVALIPEVIERGRRANEGLRGTLIGDGPERPAVAQAIAQRGLGAVVNLPGFVSDEELTEQLRGAVCLLLPSLREGYGLIVIEAAAFGTPCVTVDAPDNAAKELVVDGVNGFVVADGSAQGLADAVTRVIAEGPELRESTERWFRESWDELSVESSVRRIADLYRALTA